MRAARPLRELPGFEESLTDALNCYGAKFYYDFSQVGDATIPEIKKVDCEMLRQIAMLIWTAKDDESRRLRLVPPLRPVAANDCEGANG